MPTKKLTKTMVETVKPPKAGRVEYFDTVLPGFGLRVSAQDVKSWILFYRIDGKQVRQTLGRFPVLGLAEAREEAREALKLVAQGQDPRDVKREQQEAAAEARATTYGAVVEQFVEHYAKPRQRTWKETERVLKSLPWHKRPIGSITKREAYRYLDGLVTAGQHAKARVTLSWLKTFWRWAWKRDLVEAPVMDAVEVHVERKERDRVYTDEEIKALWSADGDLNAQERAFLKLVLLLGVRKSELLGMRREELDDLDRPTLWKVPHVRTKTAKKVTKQRTYIVPLPALARRVLVPLLKGEGDLVFPGRHKGKAMLCGSPLMRKVRAASGVDDWAPHAHRHTLGTWAENEGASEYERALLLNHAGGGSVTAGYSHGYPVELKREWLGRWAGHVSGVVQPKGVELLS